MKAPIIVTGATRGIGREVAIRLSRNHDVIATGRNAALGNTLTRDHGCQFFQGDVRDEPLHARLAALPQCRAVIHCAGISARNPISALDAQTWSDVLSVNVIAPALITRALLPALRRNRGDVVFVNSGAGLFVSEGNAVYCASKHALRAVSDTLRLEEKAAGVRVSSVHPGYVATDMAREIAEHEGVELNMDLALSPSTIARLIEFAIELPPGEVLEMTSIRPMHKVI